MVMQTKEYRTVDKSAWGNGPWTNEPDKMQWQDKATGLPCLIVRGPLGALCGYVGVPNTHGLYGKDYSHEAVAVSAHGGITFGGRCCTDGDEAEVICHVPAPGESDDIWWFGFDCAHAGDLSPKMRVYDVVFLADTYRDIAYVRAEIASLAAQLLALA